MRVGLSSGGRLLATVCESLAVHCMMAWHSGCWHESVRSCRRGNLRFGFTIVQQAKRTTTHRGSSAEWNETVVFKVPTVALRIDEMTVTFRLAFRAAVIG